MIELWIVAFLAFVAISTTASYVYGFSRGQEFATNVVIDDLIAKGLLEVVDEEDE